MKTHPVTRVLRKVLPFIALVLLSTTAASAANGPEAFAGKWPTHYVFSDGTDLGLALKYQYDVNRFSGGNGRLENAQTSRRKEFGFTLQKEGVYNATAVFDFQARTWLDVFLRVQSKALLGRDVGVWRFGQSKTPVGFEGNTGTGSTTFLEAALPTQAIYANRRLGVDWALQRLHYQLNAGYYSGGDLNGDNDGHTLGARAAWVPLNQVGKVLHLGLSGSRETPSDSRSGLGVSTPPSARFRARPEVGLSMQRLVDSGALRGVEHIDRRGLEGLWIGGPWSAQAECLAARIALADGRPAYRATGYYAFLSWVATGESRSYAGGNVGDVKPSAHRGALEFALRYSELDLDDGAISGGRQRDWTLGANWYLDQHIKLQANYVYARSSRGGLHVDPDVVELRAQIAF